MRGTPKYLDPVLLVLTLVPPAILLFVIQRYGVNVPFDDHWSFAGLFQKLEQGTLTLGDLAASHNESRMFFPRLLILPLSYLSGWNVRLEMLISFLLACLVSINVYRLGRASFPGNRTIALGLLVPANLLIFGVVQWQNWLWGFQIVAFVPIAVLTSGLVVACSRRSVTTRFLVNIGLATIATFSFSSGLLCWVVVLPVLVLLDPDAIRKKKWLVPLWLTAALVNVALYFATYTHPGHHPSPAEALRHPLEAAFFFAAVLGAPLGWVLGPEREATLAVSAGIGFTLSALFVAAAATVWLRRTNDALRRRATPWLGLAGFVLLSGGMLTAARLGFGAGYALESRYSTAALYLCVALIFLVPVLMEEQRRTGGRWGRPSMSHAATALLTLLVAAHAITSAHQWRLLPSIRHARLTGKAMLTFLDVAPNVEGLGKFLFPRPEEIIKAVRSADRQGLLDPPLLTSDRVREIAGTTADENTGALERHASRQGNLMLSGWAVLPHRAEPAHAVLLCQEVPGDEPRIFAVVASEIARPDVVERLGQSNYLRSGWQFRSTVSLPPHTVTVSAWAYDALTRTAYRLDGSAEIGPAP